MPLSPDRRIGRINSESPSTEIFALLEKNKRIIEIVFWLVYDERHVRFSQHGNCQWDRVLLTIG